MLKKLFLSFLVLLPSFAFAAELPFTDVLPGVSYYNDLKHMYDAGVIGDTSDGLFHPDGLLPRDEFVAIAVGVSCQKCLYPSPDDIIRYRLNPFADILKKNQYFYCISYAKEKEIVRGYVLDKTGKTQCQNGENFRETPFCPANNITRIEAAAVLLRQAGLWSETNNSSSFEKKIVLPDVDAYWYGYAQKSIESGLIAIGTDKKISPNEYITRKEFVAMASKIFTINMCSIKNDNTVSGLASIIKIFDKDRLPVSRSENTTIFPNRTETTYDFGGYVTGSTSPPYLYNWTFTNTNTGEQKTATGKYLDNFNLESTGSWLVKLIVTDTGGRSSTSYQEVSVVNDSINGKGISLQIGTALNGNSGSNSGNNNLNVLATTLYGTVGVPIPFFSTIKGGDGTYSYHWDFSDRGITAPDKDPLHTFMSEGVYPVTLSVHDASGNVAYAQLTVILSPNLDRDNDGMLDYDTVGNVQDACPDVFGPVSNKGCPIVNEYNGGGTDIGNIIGGGKNGENYNSANNLCLSNKIKNSGVIEGGVQCISCPCAYSSEFVAKVRSCDIIFPSITSPDKKTLYSRGSIFAVP